MILEVMRGSGNVFRDLSYENADAMQFKAVLAADIIKALDREGSSVRGARDRTGMAADFSRIRDADLGCFTVGRLITILGRLKSRLQPELAAPRRILAALVLTSLMLSAQEKAASADSKISQARQELLNPFLGASVKCLALAKAVPEEKYAWRPMEGVRSFGEVFVHMAGSTLLFCSYAGLKSPQGPAHDLASVYMKRGFEMPEIFASERAIKSKAETVDIMDQAFHMARDLVRGMPDSDLEKKVDFFGQSLTLRGLLIEMGDHLNQHLGQAIAYARVNHIVPPWSEKKK